MECYWLFGAANVFITGDTDVTIVVVTDDNNNNSYKDIEARFIKTRLKKRTFDHNLFLGRDLLVVFVLSIHI